MVAIPDVHDHFDSTANAPSDAKENWRTSRRDSDRYFLSDSRSFAILPDIQRVSCLLVPPMTET